MPCGPPAEGGSLLATPDMGWFSILPNGVGIIDLVVNGSALQFTGSGYHDVVRYLFIQPVLYQTSPAKLTEKNWGDLCLTQIAKNETFGHGNLGPYSLLYNYEVTPQGVEYASGYVTLNNEVLTSVCGNVKVYPNNANAMYPPSMGSSNNVLEGFHIEWDVGDEGILAVDAKPNAVLMQVSDVYTRWVGEIRGGIVGKNISYSGSFTWDYMGL
jgi:hypothetical protein